jgi:argininosuccinate synthase
MKKQLVLAYSGGLDTSFCTNYLAKDEGYEVHTVLVDTGGFSNKELKNLEKKALRFGAYQHHIIDATSDYYQHCIRFLIFGNVLRSRNYPVPVSSERTFQALKVINFAREMGIQTVAHGSSGAGNDQVRFEAIFQIIAPWIEVLSPIRDMRISREEVIDYLVRAGFKISFEKTKYSMNQGLWGTSISGKETFTSNLELPDEAFPCHEIKKNEESIILDFVNGEVKKLNGKSYKDPVSLIRAVEKIAAPYGIGRDFHVGETIIGIKGRIGFQASAAHVIINAHYALEKHVLSKWQQHWKEQLGNWYGMFIHEGLFLDPSMRDIESFLISSQRNVSGKVFIKLRPFSMTITGVETSKDLMNSDFARYGEENKAWTAEDVRGFTKILSNPMKIFYTVNENEKPKI